MIVASGKSWILERLSVERIGFVRNFPSGHTRMIEHCEASEQMAEKMRLS